MTYISPETRKLADLKSMKLVELADIGAKPADVERILRLSASYPRALGRIGAGFRSFRLSFGRSAGKTLSAVGKRCLDFVRVVQHGRMKSVLANMPDDVLDEIGISRSEIPAYARSLIHDDGS